MKKILALILTFCACINTVVFAQDYSQFDAPGIDVVALGEKVVFDEQPDMDYENDRVMVPLRAIFEALDAKVTWIGETNTIVSTKKDTTVIMQLGNNKMYVNGEEKILDAVPYLKGDSRTLVPVRAISESFGYNVEWIDAMEMVVITE